MFLRRDMYICGTSRKKIIARKQKKKGTAQQKRSMVAISTRCYNDDQQDAARMASITWHMNTQTHTHTHTHTPYTQIHTDTHRYIHAHMTQTQ